MAFVQWTGRRVRAAPAMGAARYLIPRIRNRADEVLVIGISVSGEVARTLEAIDLAKSTGARTMAITSSPDSSLASIADYSLTLPFQPVSGPGLISFLSSLISGYATCWVMSNEEGRLELDGCMRTAPSLLDQWVPVAVEEGRQFADSSSPEEPCVFVGSGPAYGIALFSAAKVIESAGVRAWGQDLEEWTHIEYFAEPAGMPTWILSASGRSDSRVLEVVQAAEAIGRRVSVSCWSGLPEWSPWAREALSPLGLWAAPASYAATITESLNETPFRNFGGGRNQVEGGGANLIRSSHRLSNINELSLPPSDKNQIKSA